MKDRPKGEITEKVFELISALYPDFVQALNECNLKITDFFLLSYIKHFGTDYNGKICILREQVTKQFDGVLDGSRVSILLTNLEERELILRRRVSTEEKLKVFNISGGRKDIIILSEDGQLKLKGFYIKLNQIFTNIKPITPNPIFKMFFPNLRNVAERGLDYVNRELRKEGKNQAVERLEV